MSDYKILDANQLTADLSSVANSLRQKTNTSDLISFPDGFKNAISSISTGVEVQRIEREELAVYDEENRGYFIDCGFVPDIFFIYSPECRNRLRNDSTSYYRLRGLSGCAVNFLVGVGYHDYSYHNGDIYEAHANFVTCSPTGTASPYINDVYFNRTENGVRFGTLGFCEITYLTNIHYVAIKYTK